MSSMRDDGHWIRHQLVPSLLADGKLAFGANPASVIVRSVEAVRVPMEESFMLTACYKVKIELAESSDDNAATSVIRLVAKITPDVTIDRYLLSNFKQLFHNEKMAYEQIFPRLGWTEQFPKYYYSDIGDTKSVMVLGDFATDGWRICKQMANLSLEHILVSITELGKFHGILYALKHTDRTAFDKLKDELIESRFCNEPPEQWAQRLRIGPKRAAKALRSRPDAKTLVPEAFLTRIETVMANTFQYQKQKVLPKEPLAIVAHGDYLRNNLAFRYSKDKPDVPEAAMMFDFQTLRYTSPMVDFATFIANSTGVDVRRQHFDLIFDTYHETLIRHFCDGAQLDTESVPEYLSRENFLREYAEYLPFGLSIAASFLMFLHAPDSMTYEDFASISLADDEKYSYERGGETVDRELRALLVDMYEMHQRYGLEL